VYKAILQGKTPVVSLGGGVFCKGKTPELFLGDNSVLVRQLDPFLITRRGEATRRRNQRNSKKIRVNANNAAACVDCGVSFGIYMRKYY
jgi:shikimate kinase